jgi:hypothetical protein
VADASGQTTITVKVTDADGGERRDLFVLIVDPVNDAPELDAPAEASTTEDVALAFDGTIAVTDIDDDELESVAIEATDGTVTLASTVGLDFAIGDGEDDPVLLFSGTIADVNAALDGATFLPDQDFNGEALLSIEVDDGVDTAEEIVAIEVAASNDAPVIDSDDGIDTLNVNQTRTIRLSVSDVDVTAGQDVEVTFVVSGSATIDIPDRAGLQFLDDEPDMVRFRGTLAEVNASLDGDGVDIIPADGVQDDVTLTGTVSDLGNSGGDGVRVTTRTWVTTFANPNTDPTIMGLADSRTIDEDDDGDTVTFTVGDGQTEPGNLEVTASASGNVVVALTVGGSGANRTVTAVPAPDDNGTATITVRVSDGDRSVTDTYQLVVTPLNDRPVIEPASIATVTIDEDGFADLTFAATDADGTVPTMQISSDTTALLPNSSFTMLSTTGVRIRPVAQQSGSATVTLTASDGTLTAARTFTVVVRAVNDAPVLAGTYPELTVDDEEVGEGTYQVTIDANGGTVTLATVADLTFVDGDDDDSAPDGDGSKDSHMIFRGDQDAVNDALDGLIDTVENGEIVIVVSDLGVSPPTSADPELTDSLCVEVGTGSCD